MASDGTSGRKQRRKRPAPQRNLVGWREWVLLPALSPIPIKAKVDTGAQTSSLHAFDLTIDQQPDGLWAVFEIHPTQRSRTGRSTVMHPVRGFKHVRSSTGHSQRRPVIRTTVRIGDLEYEIDVTLTARDEMGFRMLLGRSALRRHFWVDPSRSFLHPTVEAASPHEQGKDPK